MTLLVLILFKSNFVCSGQKESDFLQQFLLTEKEQYLCSMGSTSGKNPTEEQDIPVSYALPVGYDPKGIREVPLSKEDRFFRYPTVEQDIETLSKAPVSLDEMNKVLSDPEAMARFKKIDDRIRRGWSTKEFHGFKTPTYRLHGFIKTNTEDIMGYRAAQTLLPNC